MQSFKEQFIEARRAKGITQGEIADALGLTRQAVSRWENGKSLPDIDTLAALSQLLSYDFYHINAPLPSETPVRKKPFFKNKLLILCIVCFLVGTLIGTVVGYVIRHGTDITPNIAGQGYLTITAQENPVKTQRLENSAMWHFSFDVINIGDIAFTVETIEQFVTAYDSSELWIGTFSPSEVGWGNGVILPGYAQSIVGGLPVQELKSVKIVVSGTDAAGQALMFEGSAELSVDISL